jgi:chorismate synthase
MEGAAVTRPRPGHGDLAGALKYQTHDARDILERASARETAARVAAGSICGLLLGQFDIHIASHVLAIGGIRIPEAMGMVAAAVIFAIDPASSLRCADAGTETRMMALIDQAAADGDTLGGIAEIVATGVPPGLGSHSQWDRKLDGLLAQALMSIPAVKAVEIGSGVTAAGQPGSGVHDQIYYDDAGRRFYRKTNVAGGLEAGISNGADLRATVFVKPIPTLRQPLQSVDMITKAAAPATIERSDTCAVPAAGIIAEAMTAMVVANALCEKLGGDSMTEMRANYGHYLGLLDRF